MDWQRTLLIAALAVVSYMMILQWQKDYVEAPQAAQAQSYTQSYPQDEAGDGPTEVVEASAAQHRALRVKQQEEEGGDSFRGELSLVAEGDVQAKGFSIYGRQGITCPVCRTASIEKDKIAGRPVYWCPVCQKV